MRAVVLAVTLSAATAVAGPPETVVVASSDETFRAALDDALAPTGMHVIVVSDEPPTVAQLSITARQIAEREHATSTVWLILAADKTTLVTYDRDVDRVLVREVPYIAPLTAAQAAEIARMARTMLRALRVTPEVDLPLPAVAEARVVRARATVAAPPPLRSRIRQLAVGVGAGVRVGAAASDAGLDATLAVRWRPDSVGLGLHANLATRSELAGSELMGRIADDSIGLTGHLPVMTGPNIHVLAIAGVAVHRVALDGTLGASPISELRFDPAARVGVVANYEIGANLDVGVAMSADCLLRRQKYETGTSEVLVVPRLQLTTGLVLTVRIL